MQGNKHNQVRTEIFAGVLHEIDELLGEPVPETRYFLFEQHDRARERVAVVRETSCSLASVQFRATEAAKEWRELGLWSEDEWPAANLAHRTSHWIDGCIAAGADRDPAGLGERSSAEPAGRRHTDGHECVERVLKDHTCAGWLLREWGKSPKSCLRGSTFPRVSRLCQTR
jgi:hypothetical protein